MGTKVEEEAESYDDYKYFRFETNMEKGLEKTITIDFQKRGALDLEGFMSFNSLPYEQNYDFHIQTDQLLHITPDSGEKYHP